MRVPTSADSIRRGKEVFDAGIMSYANGDGANAVKLFEKALSIDPNLSEAANNLGAIYIDSGNPQRALTYLERAVALRPRYVDALFNLANARWMTGRPNEAIEGLRKASSIEPRNGKVLHALGSILRSEHRYGEAQKCLERCLRIDPKYVNAHYTLGITLSEMGLPGEALAHFDSAIASKNDFAEAHFSRSLALLQLGDFHRGFLEYEWRKRKPEAFGARFVSAPLWLGESPVHGKSIYIHREQGLGDAIQFSRYALLLQAAGAVVTLGVPASLVDLLQTLHPRVRVVDEDIDPVGFDIHCPLMSLPLAFRTTPESIPARHSYLSASQGTPLLPLDLDRANRDRLRIGFCWAANPRNRELRKRTCALHFFTAMMERIDAVWVSLQQEMSDADASVLAGRPDILDCGRRAETFMSTASVISNMDVIVSVDTSVAHVAAALGKPTFILLPLSPDWRWGLSGSQSAWYPSATLFRQNTIDIWSDVFRDVQARLVDFKPGD